MILNIVLAGLKKETGEGVLQRLEALISGLPENTNYCVYETESEECAEEIHQWAAHLPLAEPDGTGDDSPVLFCGTSRGKELAMRFAAAKGMSCYTEIISLNETNGKVVALRDVYSTHLKRELSAERAVLAASASGMKKEYTPAEQTENVKIHDFKLLAGNLIQVDYLKDTLSDEIRLETGENLAGAKLVLLGGKGLGKKENFQRLEALAEKLGASCGCTRPVAMAGWASYDKVVGISGSILSADVCIAFGVSGAGPLMAGAGGAARLVAVNNDPKAPIFKAAQDGLVADCLEILAAMEQEVQ